MKSAPLAALAALSSARGLLPEAELVRMLRAGGLAAREVDDALHHIRQQGHARLDRRSYALTAAGGGALLDAQSALLAALDPSPIAPDQETCPSVPWLTQVQTRWLEAVSLSYAVDPDALRPLIPAPLQPEIWEGSAWVQVLMSSLEDMRPKGLPSLFGVNFYQVSYRAAVCYRALDGTQRRGGYFVRSETNHPVMRLVGNALVEFRFHNFGAAEVVGIRDGDLLTLGVQTEPAGGEIVLRLDTRPLPGPPPGSVWRSIAHLDEPLVACYDAFGVDAERGYLYTLTIDREPWWPQFAHPEQIYCAWMDHGPLGGASRLDHVLSIQPCAYRWRPLRRERIA